MASQICNNQEARIFKSQEIEAAVSRRGVRLMVFVGDKFIEADLL